MGMGLQLVRGGEGSRVSVSWDAIDLGAGVAAQRRATAAHAGVPSGATPQPSKRSTLSQCSARMRHPGLTRCRSVT